MRPTLGQCIAIAVWLTLGAVVGGVVGLLGALALVALATVIHHDQLVLALFRQISLHHGGIAYRQWGRSRTVLFDDVDEVFVDVAEGGGWSAVRLREHSGAQHELGLCWLESTSGMKLLNALNEECSLCHLDSAKDALAAGERLAFGPLAIDSSAVHISVSKQLEPLRVPWSELRNVRGPFGGVFAFQDKYGKFYLVQMREVPHPVLLVQLLKALAVWEDVKPPSELAKGSWGRGSK